MSFKFGIFSGLLGAAVCLNQVFAAPISSKVIINQNTGYYTLSDGTIWKVFSLSPRWRNVSEWWNDVKLMPEIYETTPDDWYLGSDVQFLTKLDHIDFDESAVSDKKLLARATHILVNSSTGKHLFAVSLCQETCLNELYKDSYQQGYNCGYDKGSRINDVNAAAQYEKGYEAGYYTGYKEATKEFNSNNRNNNRVNVD
jgi:hypothetical protein